ncbi:palmitoyltransferase ZDHHC20-B-like [Amphibalanus amphitrite]|uniref:palmitoyltransferase ZDHHC20-B-like n=1 Tax=Amphibalanus amphitrite TaxID=1232801 RepID=UPI001C927B41|nr:palmitoyltransferase ZDHHC20-B-like [Amphibalanus amphitrite]XP_043223296.1 palmitoyltransferase ZDHHC20-B-like [Amphibalanus amphitrite]XP_043223297.1 palmitoyltransferase ZDHHC20-B-like [Amphibalanus amphitrite]
MTHIEMANVVDIVRKPCNICICFSKWIPVIFILGVVGWSYYAYVIELNIFTVESYAEKTVYLILYHIVLVLFLWAYYQTVMTPIARVPKQFRLSDADQAQFDAIENRRAQGQLLERHAVEQHLPVYNRTMTGGAVRYCEKCRLIKPDRCHHCSVCSECVLKMDHHCPWVNNCIGFSNYKFFVLFLGYAFAYCVFIALTSLQYFIGFWRDGLEGMARFHILFLFFVSTMFGISLISLFSYHCYLVIRNQSTLETFRPPIFYSGPDKRGFSMTRYGNFCQVFGDSKLKWFLPVFTSIGDGVSFPMRHQPLTSVSYGTTDEPAGGPPAASLGGSPGGSADRDLAGQERWEGSETGPAHKYSNGQSDEPEVRSDVRLIVE